MNENQKAFLAARIGVNTAIFAKGESYTKLVMIAGFGGFFAIWHLVKEDLAPPLSTIAALLMIASVSSFVLFEVWKMIVMAPAYRRLVTAVKSYDIKSDEDFGVVMDQADMKFQLSMARVNSLWMFALISTVLFGVSAMGVLVVALVKALVANLCR